MRLIDSSSGTPRFPAGTAWILVEFTWRETAQLAAVAQVGW